MSDLRYTLLTDGRSDKALIPILTWLLRQNGIDRAIQSEWADLWRLPAKPQTLTEKIERSLELYPCDLLFVHRDAEGKHREHRVSEIKRAMERAKQNLATPPVACVVPVRMQEAWLLFDEAAIRRAAGNPHGQNTLHLPDAKRVENIPDPKRELFDLLRNASGLSRRRLGRFAVHRHAYQIPTYIEDFAPLRALDAFNSLEFELKQIIREQEWHL